MTMVDDDASTVAEAQAFVGQLFGWVTGAGIAMMIDVAARSGVLQSVADGSGTSREVAERAGLSERHVREAAERADHRRRVRDEPAGTATRFRRVGRWA